MIRRAEVLDGTPHLFLGRQGGVSRGIYATLNCGLGSGDDPADVAENRRRSVAALGAGLALATVRQVHGRDAVEVTEAWPDDTRPEADAMATRVAGIALGVLTADCAPVLLADREAGVVGAAHAGWQGAKAGVIASVVALMTRLGARAERMAAVIGPCIARASYEVTDAFRANFGEECWFGAGVRAGHWQFDLESYVAEACRRAGVGMVEACHIDTYAGDELWFSYRRSVHRGEGDYGRQLSLIAL